MLHSVRSLVVSILALWRGFSQKEIGARSGIPQKQVSYHLQKEELEEGVFRRLLQGVLGRPAQVAIVTACLESLDASERDGELTVEERDEVEMAVLDIDRLAREALTEAALRSRSLPPLNVYPEPAHLEPARWLAGEQWALLKGRSEEQQRTTVREDRRYQHWALAERLCEESVNQTSRDLERAAGLARLAREVAERVQGPEEWRSRVRGYAAAHEANVLRVEGELKEAEASFEQAKRLWVASADPNNILDPGRLLDLEASLCRDQRRFEEAVAFLDQAFAVGRRRGRILINKGFTLEVMGEYERAIKTLLQAEALIDQEREHRLYYMLRFNMAVTYTHVGRYGEAVDLVQQVRELVTERGDDNELIRVTWLDGRIAAGLDRPEEAQALLRQARQAFAAKEMWYDVALALLEEAVLLLDQGRTTEVKVLAQGLKDVFESKGVHREALAALRLFQEAAQLETATAELAQRVLRFLFRARYDQGLRLTPS
ncbi:MAG TPA: tetratricopeptide repeat protein [Thermoanaerobaculia bacterium]|nr:tetratricopeptide repeat protein [Thermoanaerobaculia bacterium]